MSDAEVIQHFTNRLLHHKRLAEYYEKALEMLKPAVECGVRKPEKPLKEEIRRPVVPVETHKPLTRTVTVQKKLPVQEKEIPEKAKAKQPIKISRSRYEELLNETPKAYRHEVIKKWAGRIEEDYVKQKR